MIRKTSSRAKSNEPELRKASDLVATSVSTASGTAPLTNHGSVKQTAAEKDRGKEAIFKVPQAMTDDACEPKESYAREGPQVHGDSEFL